MKCPQTPAFISSRLDSIFHHALGLSNEDLSRFVAGQEDAGKDTTLGKLLRDRIGYYGKSELSTDAGDIEVLIRWEDFRMAENTQCYVIL